MPYWGDLPRGEGDSTNDGDNGESRGDEQRRRREDYGEGKDGRGMVTSGTKTRAKTRGNLGGNRTIEDQDKEGC